MKTKELAWAIILHAFLGYLWILFMNHIVGLTNAMDNVFIQAIIIIIGSTLFAEIVRHTPYHQYKISHPMRIAGIGSFLIVVLGSVLFKRI